MTASNLDGSADSGRAVRRSRHGSARRRPNPRSHLAYEQVETRILLAADWGDAPESYPVNSPSAASHLLNTVWERTGDDLEGFNAEDHFGGSVAVSGDGHTVAVGAAAVGEGYVKIYRLDPLGTTWNQIGSLTGDFGGARFGSSLAVSQDGNVVAVGAPGSGQGENQFGTTSIFQYSQETWVAKGGQLTGESKNDRFGAALALNGDGNTVAIAAPENSGEDGEKRGQATVYRWNASAAAWNQLGTAVSGEQDSGFLGCSIDLSLDGRTFAVGSYGFDAGSKQDAGLVGIYQWNGSDWQAVGSGIKGEDAGDFSGRSVALADDGMTVAMGAPYNSDAGAIAGHARVFFFNTINGQWQKMGQTLEGSTFDQLGSSVALSGDGETIAIGAPFNDEGGVDSGHTQVHVWSGSEWIQKASIIKGEGQGDQSGAAIAISQDGHTVVAGAPLNDGVGLNAGHARVLFLPTLVLGPRIDAESGGQSSSMADGDGDDDDGVLFGLLEPGQIGQVSVVVNGSSGRLDAWVDFDGDGLWDDLGERVFTNREVQEGTNLVSFNVPESALVQYTFARFRLSPLESLFVGQTGEQPLGEVEDYQVLVAGQNGSPTLDAISDQNVQEDSSEKRINLTGIDDGDVYFDQPIRIEATSEDPSLLEGLQVDYESGDSAILRFTPSPDQFGTTTLTVSVEDAGYDGDFDTLEDNASVERSFEVTVQPLNDPPRIDPIDPQTIAENSSEQFLTLSGINAGEGENQNLKIDISSDNENLLPNNEDYLSIDYSSPDSTALLKFKPTADRTGTALVTVTVEDDGADGDLNTTEDNSKVSRNFLLTVKSNLPPTLDALDDCRFDQGVGTQTVELTGISDGDETSQELRVTAITDNLILLPHPEVDYLQGESSGTIELKPRSGQFGTALITVVIEDGGSDDNLNTPGDNLSFSQTFRLDVTQMIDTGNVDYFEDAMIELDGERWYRGTAKRDGVITAQTVFDSSEGSVSLELLDSEKNLLTRSETVTGGQRLDHRVVADQPFYLKMVGAHSDVDLRLLNLVNQVDRELNVFGTGGDNQLSFVSGNQYRLVVDGVDYLYGNDDLTRVRIDGGPGHDSIWIGGSTGDENVTLRYREATVSSTGLLTTAVQIEHLTFVGRGGNDQAELYDTDNPDTFTSNLNWSLMEGDDYYHMVRGVQTVTGHASLGYDLAYMRDSAGDDNYQTSPDQAVMTMDSNVNTAIGFKRTSGTASGGNDVVISRDSSGADRLISYDDRAILSGQGYNHTSINFEVNQMIASGNSGDVAYLYDSSQDDQMVARPESTMMIQPSRETAAEGFQQTFAYASTGFDTAQFYDTAGDDSYNGYMDRGLLKGEGVFLWGRDFDQYEANFTEGEDVALMFDSPGNDTYVARLEEAIFSNQNVSNRVLGYDSISAFSNAGDDSAELHDSAGIETLRAYPDRAILRGDNMFSWTRGFSQVTVYSSGGGDLAQLYDSEGDDTFWTEGAAAQMTGDGYMNRAVGFLTNYGYAYQGGSDTANMHDTEGADLYRTYSNEVIMGAGPLKNTAVLFDSTVGYSSDSLDSARLFDTNGNETFLSNSHTGTLLGNGWSHTVEGFARNTVYGTGGFDQATMVDSAGDDSLKARSAGVKLTLGSGTIFDVRAFDDLLARSINGGEDLAELLEFEYEFELEGDWNN
ncbi:MAG: FG-GAP repeat protein [Mariniblastus sp.]|nr:FG-GAP repeat protein [Mariniblastus sp.]